MIFTKIPFEIEKAVNFLTENVDQLIKLTTNEIIKVAYNFTYTYNNLKTEDIEYDAVIYTLYIWVGEINQFRVVYSKDYKYGEQFSFSESFFNEEEKGFPYTEENVKMTKILDSLSEANIFIELIKERIEEQITNSILLEEYKNKYN